MIKLSIPRRLIYSCASLLTFFANPALRAADYATTVLADKPVAYYRFEETNGSTAFDSSTNAFDGTYNFNTSNSPSLGQPGIDSNSISFVYGSGGNSDSGNVDVPFNTLLSPVAANGSNGSAFSMEVWLQPTTTPANGTYTVPVNDSGGFSSYPNSSGWNLYQVGGNDPTIGNYSEWIFNLRNTGAFVQIYSPIQLLEWYHLAMAYDGTNLTCYVNGISQGTFSGVGYLANPGSGDLTVANGGNTGQLNYQGGVDELALYDYPITAAQVLNHYQIGTNEIAVKPTAAGLLTPPVSVTNYAGTTATFSAQGNGTLPLLYQWFRGSSLIPAATNSSYSFISQYPADNNVGFHVVVTNNYGSATSAVVTLTVQTNLNIVTPPVSIARNINSFAAFRVIANGALPLTYQWLVSPDGGNTFTNISGQTSRSLWLTNVQLSMNNYLYEVIVGNPFSSNSASATLSVQARAVNVPLTGYASIVAASHPVAYYRLDETNADYGTATDAVGSFDGTYTDGNGSFLWDLPPGIPRETDGAVGVTNGATIQIPYAVELNPDVTWTAEEWLQPTVVDGNYRVVLSSEYNEYPNPYNGYYIYQEPAPGSVFAFVPQPSGIFISAGPDDPANANAVVANKWYHLVITDDGTNFTMYINGEARTSYPVASSGFTPNGAGINPDGSSGTTGGADNADTVLGMRTDGAFSPFEGTIDDTAFYNYALSAQEIMDHYLNRLLLTLTKSGNQGTLTFGVGTLESSTNVNGPYTPVTGATSGYTFTPSAAHQYYRLQTVP